jgi:hypothetical protein
MKARVRGRDEDTDWRPVLGRRRICGDARKRLQRGDCVSDANVVIDKLRHIEELWEKLKAVKTNTPEYAVLIKQIGVLSIEYQQLAEVAKKPE